MRKILLAGLLLMLSVSTFSASIIASPHHEPTLDPSVIRLELMSEPLEFKKSVRDEGIFTTFSTSQSLVGEAGAPALPMVSELVGIPAETLPTLTFKLPQPQTLPALSHPLEPIPTYKPVIEPTVNGYEENRLEATYQQNRGVYSQDVWYPKQQVRMSEPMTMRGQSIVRVEFMPVQVNLATGELRWFKKADITLSWEDDELKSVSEPVSDPYFESIFARTLHNYEAARSWRSSGAIQKSPDISGNETRWLISLEEQGLFKLPLVDLAAAGVDVSNPERLAIYYGSGTEAQEQAIWLDDQNLYLINTREHGYWSKKIVYNLKVLESGTGLRMAELVAAPTQPTTVTEIPYELRFEEDKEYKSLNSSTREGEQWHWKEFFVLPGTPIDTFTHIFDLPHLASQSEAVVTSELGPEHRLNTFCYKIHASVNNQSAEQQWTTNYIGFQEVITVPQSDLSATGNIYEVQQQECGGVSTLVLNAFTVQYQRKLVVDSNEFSFINYADGEFNYLLSGLTSANIVAFETSSLNEPQRLTQSLIGDNAPYTFTFGRPAIAGETYLVTTLDEAKAVDSIRLYEEQGLRTDLSQADYLIITHPDFAEAMQPLLEWRQSQDYTARMVSLDDIYNDFGNGTTDPEAIRNFIEYAYQNWQKPAPAYIVLVGDSSYDPFDILETGVQVWLPSLFVYKDLYLGNVPSDHAFVTGLDAGDSANDLLADAFIGRLPANSAEEAADMVEKIVRYESEPSSLNDWRRKLLFVADDPDDAGNFYQLSDHLLDPLNLIPERAIVEKSYYLEPDSPYQTVEDVRDKIVEEMNNSGLLIMQYIGHSGYDFWASGGVWSVRRGDLDLLEPSDQLPFSLPWTCIEGYFINPERPSVGESMMRLPDRGVIGSFSPVGLDVAKGHDDMAQGFYQALFANDGSSQPQTQLGPLTIHAKMELNASYNRMWYTYMLYGDPALRLYVAPCLLDDSSDCNPEPTATATATATVTPTPTATATATATPSQFVLHLPLIIEHSTSR